MIMATKKVYDTCCRMLRKMNLTSLHCDGSNKRILKPNMKFLFGKKELVTKIEFDRCGESEKRRHLREDDVLRSMYIELYAFCNHPVNTRPGAVKLTKNV